MFSNIIVPSNEINKAGKYSKQARSVSLQHFFHFPTSGDSTNLSLTPVILLLFWGWPMIYKNIVAFSILG